MVSFINMINKIFSGSSNEKTEKTIDEILSNYDFSQLPEPRVTGNLYSDETLLVVDDIELSEVLYESDFNNIKVQSERSGHILDIYSKYKIVHCLGSGCSLQAYKFIHLDKNPIKKAILDITLGESYKVGDVDYVEINGVDLANYVWVNNPDSGVRLLTAHTMDENNKTVMNFILQFKEYTNKNIADYVINKNSNTRTERLYEFLR